MRSKEMKVLYEPISVLLSYNEYLVNWLVKLGVEVYLDAPGYIFANLMYIHEKARGRLRGRMLPSYFVPNMIRVRVVEHYAKKVNLIHLNGLNLPMTTLFKFKNDMGKPILFVLHSAPLSTDVYEVLNDVVDTYVAPSNFTLSQEASKIRKRAVVIHHGIDVEEFKPMPKNIARMKLGFPLNRKVILWNDRISPEKDIETLLKAIPLVLRECKECYFYIKGRGVNKGYWRKVRTLLKHIPRENLKLHIGWISRSTLPYLYRAADIFVRTQRHENFGLAFIEAMACGTPVVASDAATAREVVGNAGLLFKEGDPQDLADKILSLLENENLQKELSQKARERVLKYFTSEKMAKEYLKLYHELIK